MRNVLLAAHLAATTLVLPGRASAQCGVLGLNRSFGWGAPGFVGSPGFVGAPGVVVVSPYAVPSPYAYAYGSSYFRPGAPYGAQADRNWRDTWRDDGIKVHSYTWH